MLNLAVWPDSNNRQYWNNQDSWRSMWLSLRSSSKDGGKDGDKIVLDHYNPDGVATSNVGIYVWASRGFDCAVEVKAHDVYSASAHELTQLAKWLTTMNKKIEKADIPRGFGVKETLILTLRAMGVKTAVKISADWQSEPEIIGLEEGLSLANYAGPLEEMEALRKQPYGDAV